jgi:integrase
VRFHDLRHSFGTIAVAEFPLSDVQAWMGHADIHTTMRYVHHVPKHDAADRLGRLLDGADVAPNVAPNARVRRSREAVEHE